MSYPLEGLRILDFTALLPGPFATMMLADLGADVLRVEAPGRPDLVRFMQPFDDGESAAHGQLGRNKRSIALDLKKPEGLEVARKLVETYDIVIEQFRPGVMDRLGLGYEDLRKINPAVIYCSITGYGQTGPYRDRAGHDINYLALSGVASYSGRKQGGPCPFNVQIADVGAGSYNAVVGILAAVVMRQRTGEGQTIDISMTDGAIAWNGLEAPSALVGGTDPRAEEEMLNGGGYYDFYMTRDGRYMAVGSLEPQFFAALATGLGHPEWAAEYSADYRETARFKPMIAERFVAKTMEEWVEIFGGGDACVSPVLTISEMADDPHVKAREMIIEVSKTDGETQRQIASPIKFSGAGTRSDFVGCPVGQHTREVLLDAGYTEDEIIALSNAGVLGDALSKEQ